jgi:hypothetical protein
MAVIVPGLKCPLCGSVLGDGAELAATTHFIGDPNHHLWRFSDAAMHRKCFASWEHRTEFIDLYNDTLGMQVWGDGTRHHMHPDGSITSEPVEP